MGGGYYDHEVARAARSTRRDVFQFQGYAAEGATARSAHPALSPHGTIRECANTTPIVIALDVTRSRGDDSRLMYDKLPLFLGQLELGGYVEGAALSLAAIGDSNSDAAPLQVGQFEADNRLDEVLTRFWIEEGGGGTGQESYELAAYYYAKHSQLACLERGEKGYFFFVGDEGFYPKVEAKHIKKWLGREDVTEDVDSAQVFRELQEKYKVFMIYPKKSWRERKADIDAEIKQRVEAAGGQYAGVDVRASLIWNNRNDLDLHVICPSGEEIYYGAKQSQCGGWLDVDMNVRGESLKPVENVRWKKGEAPAGKYRIFVQNYRFHDEPAPTEFRLEVEINGAVQHFDGVVSPNLQVGGQSNVTVYEFTYDPNQREIAELDQDAYAGYDDAVIKRQWASVLPQEHILEIEDPRAIIDVTLGALALSSGKQNLDEYLASLRTREADDERQRQVTQALQPLSDLAALSRVSLVGGGQVPAGGANVRQRTSGARL
jgi:hypothetical protein